MKGSLEVVNIEIHCLGERNYAMMLVASYRTLEGVRDEKKMILIPTRAPDAIKMNFNYPELVHNHFQYRDFVDEQNGSRMYPITLEET